MRSLLVFLHLAIITRLSEGAPLPQTEITAPATTTVNKLTCETLVTQVGDPQAALVQLQTDGTTPAGLENLTTDELTTLLQSCSGTGNTKLASPGTAGTGDGRAGRSGGSSAGGSGGDFGDGAGAGGGDPSAYSNVAYVGPSTAEGAPSSSTDSGTASSTASDGALSSSTDSGVTSSTSSDGTTSSDGATSSSTASGTTPATSSDGPPSSTDSKITSSTPSDGTPSSSNDSGTTPTAPSDGTTSSSTDSGTTSSAPSDGATSSSTDSRTALTASDGPSSSSAGSPSDLDEGSPNRTSSATTETGYPDRPSGDTTDASRYPPAFSATAPPGYANYGDGSDSDLGATGGGADRGDSDTGFGRGVQRVASPDSEESCKGVLCTNIATANAAGDAAASPALRLANLSEYGMSIPIVNISDPPTEKCPKGDMYACADEGTTQ